MSRATIGWNATSWMAVVGWRLTTEQLASLMALGVIGLAAVALRPLLVHRAGT